MNAVPVHDLEVLLAARQAWDAKPSDGRRADAMVDAAKAVAAHLGLDTSRLRDRLNDGRIRGLDHSDAIRAAIGAAS